MNDGITRNPNGEVLIGDFTARELTERFGSPLYVYDEDTLRNRCAVIKEMCRQTKLNINYAVKANSSVGLLKIIRDENIDVEVMTLGEIYTASAAGFPYSRMLFVSNNVAPETFKTVSDFGITVCLDAVCQITSYGQVRQSRNVYIRLNPARGEGHHEKVITAGKVKFGIDLDQIDSAFAEAKKWDLEITGFCTHIGSKFNTYEVYHENVVNLLKLAEKYPSIEYLDFGGGFGIPYDRTAETPFPFEAYTPVLHKTLTDWVNRTERKIKFGIQPGRYLVAESGICLTRVITDKINRGIRFIGTDLGFNFLLRPTMYDAYHEIINASRIGKESDAVTVTGNICESGDILGKDRLLPKDTTIGDILIVRDTGAYGYSMSGNYNSMPRPAEILINRNKKAHIIRKAENYDDIPQQANPVPLKPYTSFKLGGPADAVCFPSDITELNALLHTLKANEIRFLFLGKGSNTIFTEAGFRGCVIIPSGSFKEISVSEPNIIKAGTGVMNMELSAFARKAGMGGAAFLSTIPGTVGGAVFMNAGAYGREVCDILVKSDCLDTVSGQIISLSAEEHVFSYRCSIFHERSLAVLFAYFRTQPAATEEILADEQRMKLQRRTNQPINRLTWGSVFKNPEGNSAGKLIEACGLKGKGFGSAVISPKHANFIENTDGNAAFADTLRTVQLAQPRVKDKFGISLSPEVRIYDEHDLVFLFFIIQNGTSVSLADSTIDFEFHSLHSFQPLRINNFTRDGIFACGELCSCVPVLSIITSALKPDASS
ncbi:hypothetical protein CHS0354_001976 [Potamilus streckersoni]|uniref:UDP-N-acetylmuramate dehydrogenase n=1 Tax=Potamilus streckersoni TaxID=2493646 RepID=A0AAE0W7P9_9BIVA|nr:hypothetical protein CHS0354_001976 [Potamilus streckersoni]